MKKLVSIILLLILTITFSSCGNTKVVNGIEYDTYGLLNQDEKKNPNIEYELITGNLVWRCILFSTVAAPIYFFGFSLFQPVGDKIPTKGQVIK